MKTKLLKKLRNKAKKNVSVGLYQFKDIKNYYVKFSYGYGMRKGTFTQYQDKHKSIKSLRKGMEKFAMNWYCQLLRARRKFLQLPDAWLGFIYVIGLIIGILSGMLIGASIF